MNVDKKTEWFPVVDEEGNTIGMAPRHVCHDSKSFLLHPVIHLHVFNSKGELYLQKRSAKKDVQPGKWDTSVGGHVNPGEKPAEAVLREAFEELRLDNIEPDFIRKYIWRSEREHELVYSFRIMTDQVPVINLDEIDEGKYWSLQEISTSKGKGIFTPNFEHEMDLMAWLNL